jgi:hypothetical protein
VAVDASLAQMPAEAGGLEDALFSPVREQAEVMIGWARSAEALAAEHHVLEERAMSDGMELMRLLVQAHLELRALREQHRDDVTDADGDTRVTCEDGQERGRVMIFGDVTASRKAYRRKGKENLYPQDAELNWGPRCYSAGVERRIAEAIAVMPAERAAAQVSRMGAVTVGKRQAQETAEAYAVDFEGFYASRRPEPCPEGWAVLLSCDGSAFTVLPSARVCQILCARGLFPVRFRMFIRCLFFALSEMLLPVLSGGPAEPGIPCCSGADAARPGFLPVLLIPGAAALPVPGSPGGRPRL